MFLWGSSSWFLAELPLSGALVFLRRHPHHPGPHQTPFGHTALNSYYDKTRTANDNPRLPILVKGLLSCFRLANAFLWLAFGSRSVYAQVNITFPIFKDEATQKRVTYYEGDSLLVTWSAITVIQWLDLYCTKDELSWGDKPYGRGVMESGFYAKGDIGNAKNSKYPLVTSVSGRDQQLSPRRLPEALKNDVLFMFRSWKPSLLLGSSSNAFLTHQ